MQGNPYVTGADAKALMESMGISEVDNLSDRIHTASTVGVKPFFSKVVVGGKNAVINK